MKINKLLTLIALGGILFTSCSDDNTPDLPKGDYDNGILISGEGSGASTGSISYVSEDFSTSENLIYKKVNNSEFGTYLQSMAFDKDRAFVVVDNQNTITAVDRFTFEKVGSLTESLETPRYMTVAKNKGYVTNWGLKGAFVAVYDMNDYSFIRKINIGSGPERILERSGKLYVSHKGGFGTNNIISVINISNDEVVEVEVNDNPDEMFFDNSGNLVVLCEGGVIYDANWNVVGNTLGSVSKIDLSTKKVTNLNFEEGVHPSLMEYDNGYIYYSIGTKVYKMKASDSTLPSSEYLTVKLFETGYSSFYGMEVKNNKFYALSTRFSDVSELKVYNLSDKMIIKTFDAPVGASKIYFNN